MFNVTPSRSSLKWPWHTGVMVLICMIMFFAKTEVVGGWIIDTTELRRARITERIEVCDVSEIVNVKSVYFDSLHLLLAQWFSCASIQKPIYIGRESCLTRNFWVYFPSQFTKFVNIEWFMCSNDRSSSRCFKSRSFSCVYKRTSCTQWFVGLQRIKQFYAFQANPRSLILLKGSNLLFKSFFGNRSSISSRDGLILSSLNSIFRSYQSLVQNSESNSSYNDSASGYNHHRPLWPKLPLPVLPLLSVPFLVVGGWLMWLALWEVKKVWFVLSYCLLVIGWGFLICWIVFDVSSWLFS
jgi:hypothetical protein